MKKAYIAPALEVVLFESEDALMYEEGSGFIDPWGTNAQNYTYLPDGTIVDKNGRPAYIPD